jgi:hypothetical protein
MMPDESTLSSLATYILATVRREAPVLTAVLKTDCRTLKANGADWADENRVFRTLTELEAAGLIVRTAPDANEWTRAEVVDAVRVRQRELFA